jgi:hypothetical protein
LPLTFVAGLSPDFAFVQPIVLSAPLTLSASIVPTVIWLLAPLMLSSSTAAIVSLLLPPFSEQRGELDHGDVLRHPRSAIDISSPSK